MTTLRTVSGRLVRRLAPQSLRFRFTEVAALQRLAGRTPVDPDAVSPEARERSLSRWRVAHPEADLTWGEQLSGQGFVEKLREHGQLSEQTRLLEIGPGYGRLLDAYLGAGLPFASYTGLDLSEFNVEHLRKQFDDPRIAFIQGDAAATPLTSFDIGFSSLVFKHFYPSFEAAVTNCASALAPNGRLIFDLIEGSRAYFEHDDATFVRSYERAEVEELLARAGLRVLRFDQVDHGRNRIRLLVIAGH